MTSQEGTSGVGRGRAIWSRATEKDLIGLCHVEWQKGHHLNGIFSDNTLGTIVNRLNVRYAPLGVEYTVKGVANKLKNYKRCWQFLHGLRTDATGMGWDDVKETVVMDEDRFKEYCQRSSQNKGFIINGCPAYAQCTDLWEPVVALGHEAISSGAPMSTDEAFTGGGSQSVSYNPFVFMGDSGPGEGSGGGQGRGKGKVPTAGEDREARMRSCANFDAWSADPNGDQKRQNEMKQCVAEIKAMPIPYSLKLKGFKAMLKKSIRHLWMALDDEDKLPFLQSLD